MHLEKHIGCFKAAQGNQIDRMVHALQHTGCEMIRQVLLDQVRCMNHDWKGLQMLWIRTWWFPQVHSWPEAVNGGYIAILQVWMIISGWMFQTALLSSSSLCTNAKWYVSHCLYIWIHTLTHGNTVALYYYCQACDCSVPRRCEYCCMRWLETQMMKMIRLEFKLQT
jgi:hypothetical protein